MKFFKGGKEEYAFSVDKKTHDIKIRLNVLEDLIATPEIRVSQRNCH